jgi:hypothetical protein
MLVPLMHVTRLLENVFTLQFQFLLLQTSAPFLLVTARTESTVIQRTVTITILAPSTLAILLLEIANTKERTVTIAMHVLLILAMLLVDNALTFLWFVLMSILAPKKLAILFKDASTLLNMT